MAGAEATFGFFVKKLHDEVFQLRAAFDVFWDAHFEVGDVGKNLVRAAAVKRGGAKRELKQENAVRPPINGGGLVDA